MRIHFTDKSYIPQEPEVDHLYWVSQIEGDMILQMDTGTCLICPDELLFAVAVIMKRWLRLLEDNPLLKFDYYSMNYDRDSILTFAPTDNPDAWRIESVWDSNFLTIVSKEALTLAVSEFIRRLEMELAHYSVDLEAEYEEHVDDFLRTYQALRIPVKEFDSSRGVEITNAKPPA